MKFASLKLSALIATGLLAVASQAQAAACDVTDAYGKWGFSATGIDVAAGGVPFSEVGYISIKADGTGKGLVHFVMNGMYIPNIPITLNSFTLDTATCLGTGSITIGPNPPKPHVFMLTSQGKEIHIIDASGGHTSLGIAKKM